MWLWVTLNVNDVHHSRSWSDFLVRYRSLCIDTADESTCRSRVRLWQEQITTSNAELLPVTRVPVTTIPDRDGDGDSDGDVSDPFYSHYISLAKLPQAPTISQMPRLLPMCQSDSRNAMPCHVMSCHAYHDGHDGHDTHHTVIYYVIYPLIPSRFPIPYLQGRRGTNHMMGDGNLRIELTGCFYRSWNGWSIQQQAIVQYKKSCRSGFWYLIMDRDWIGTILHRSATIPCTLHFKYYRTMCRI